MVLLSRLVCAYVLEVGAVQKRLLRLMRRHAPLMIATGGYSLQNLQLVLDLCLRVYHVTPARLPRLLRTILCLILGELLPRRGALLVFGEA